MNQPIDPKLADAYKRVTLAGIKLMYDPKMAKYFDQGLKSGGNPVDILATNVAGILRIIDDRTGMNVPKQVLIPAGVAIMQELVNFVKEAGLFEVNEQVAQEALQKMVALLAQEYKVFDEKVAQGKGRQQQAQLQQPQQPQQPQPQQQMPQQGLINQGA
jgi:hypothetical protein